MREYKNACAWSLSACLISEVAITKVINNLTEENFIFDKIICFYAHGFNRRTKKYKIEHVKTLDYKLE